MHRNFKETAITDDDAEHVGETDEVFVASLDDPKIPIGIGRPHEAHAGNNQRPATVTAAALAGIY